MTAPAETPAPPEAPAAPAPPGAVYDRSSLTGDYLVMIAGQTPEDFERYAPEMQFCEYLDGFVSMPSPVTDRHQGHVGFVLDLLNGFRCERGGVGLVRMGPTVLRISGERKPEPDFFVRPEPGPDRPLVPALLVVELLSPSTRHHDLVTKRAVYHEAGIPEVWFLDDRDHTLIVERRAGDGYQRAEYTGGILHSAALPGFWVDVSWFWADPLPNPRRCLEAILAGPPA